jgi:tetratricopeptide (TPR) repeat protein
LLDESIALSRALALPRGLGTATALRADIHLHEAEYDAARDLYREALGLSFQAMGVIYCLCGLGLALANAGHGSEALAALARARDISERSAETYFAGIVPNTLGWIHRELGDHEGALRHDRAAVELAERDGLAEASAHAWLNLHADHSARGEHAEAAAALREAERLCTVSAAPRPYQCTNTRHALRLGLARGSDALARGELDAAEQHARELAAAAARDGAVKYVVLAHRLLADVHTARGDVAPALAELAAAEHALGDRSIPFVTWKLLALRARLLERVGEAQAAAESRGRAARIAHELAAGITDERLRSCFLGQPDVQALLGASGLPSHSDGVRSLEP